MGTVEAMGAPAARARREGELAEIVIEVLGHLDLESQLDVFVRQAAAWTGAPATLALAQGEEPGTLRIATSSVAPADVRHRAFGHLDAAHVRAVLGDRPSLHDDIGPLLRIAGEWPGDETRCGVLPLVARGGAWLGVLLVVSREPIDSGGWARLVELVEASRVALDHARTVAAMRDLIIKDDTAHCYNRRYFEEFLPEELSRATRFRAPLSLIFLDMDNLKEVNNEHGHAMGSRTLTEVSSRIRRKIRKFDRLFRFGGDEFCILLPETEWHGAMEVAERVREAVAGTPFLTAELGPGRGVRMTASLGIAAYPLHARNQQDLVEQADRAMQRIKKDRKNGVAVAEMGDSDEGDASG